MVRLVLFNPGSVAAVIKSLSTYKLTSSSNYLLRMLRVERWVTVENARWWPTDDHEDKTPKCVADKYRCLYVKEQMDILVLLPGRIESPRYFFHIKTNNGECRVSVSVDPGERSHFPHASERDFSE